MCNVHCVRRYCRCSHTSASFAVVFTRCILLSLFIVFPIAMICAVLDEFYEIKGNIETIPVTAYNDNYSSIDFYTANNNVSSQTNYTVAVRGGWQWMTIHIKHPKVGQFKKDYYKTWMSPVCENDPKTNHTKNKDCNKLNNTHNNGVRFFFSCMAALIWSVCVLFFVSFHGTTIQCGANRQIKCCSISRVSVIYGCFLMFGFIPEILLIIFQLAFSSDDAFCGMNLMFNELIEDYFKNKIVVVHSKYHSCDYYNSNIEQLPLTWIPGMMMGLMLLFLIVYKPISPLIRRIIGTCSCCVDRKISDSMVPIARNFSFSNSAAGNHKILPAPRKYSGSVN